MFLNFYEKNIKKCFLHLWFKLRARMQQTDKRTDRRDEQDQ